MNRTPSLRTGLVADTSSGELVVLDTATGEAHLLKGEAVEAYRACESGQGSAPAAGIEALEAAGLIAADPSRRKVLQVGAVLGGALVTTLALPAVQAAASGTTGGPGGGGGTSTYYGFPQTSRANLDGYTTFYFAVDAPVLPAGQLTSFDGYAQAAGSVYGVIFSPTYQVLYTSATQTVPVGTFSIPSSFAVPAGSLLGLGIVGGSVVPFDLGGPTIHYSFDNRPKPAVGSQADLQGTSPRTYSFGAFITT